MKSGGKELALELEAKGYGWLEADAAPARSEGLAMSSVVEHPGAGPVERYVAEFEAAADRRPAGPAWLEARRRDAMERFTALGLPTTRDEEYRFTNVGPITATEFVRAAEASVDRAAIAEHLYGDAVAAEIVFVNGRFAASLSRSERRPTGVVAGRLADHLQTADAASLGGCRGSRREHSPP